MMGRWLPFPRMSLALLAMWLLLQQSLAPGAWALGLVLALLLPRLLLALGHARVEAHKPLLLARLASRVLIDVVRSNFVVAGHVLYPRPRRPGFVRLPLRLHEPNGLAALACIISATPGTIWVDHDPARSELMLHVFDQADEDIWVDAICARYEPLLLEIFR